MSISVAGARHAHAFVGSLGRLARNRARLKFLVADWGVEKVREVLDRPKEL